MFHNTRQQGRAGEFQALDFLKRKGYTIIEQNYRVKLGEIDIIARDKRTLVFVEVKWRADHRFGRALEAIDARKQRKLTQVAWCYLKQHRLMDKPARFDIVAIEKGGQEPTLICNAFAISEV